MNNEMTKQLSKDGATLVFLDVPPGTEFGIDLNVSYTGEMFKGIKMIPPGFHFVFFSATSKEGSSAPRTGFFHWFKSKELLVKKWHKFNENISEDIVSEEEIEQIRSNLSGDLDRYLGRYSFDEFRKWVSLTSNVTEELMLRLEPENKVVSSVAELVPLVYPPPPKDAEMEVDVTARQSTSRKQENIEDKLLPDMKIKQGTAIRFTEISKHDYPEGSTPSEITFHSIDPTFKLEKLIKSFSKPVDILGEVQIAFICFLIGQNYDAFEQWKVIVHLLTTSDSAIEKYLEVYYELISVLYFQIREVPKDFFVDIVSSENFLTTSLQIFFQNLETSQAGMDLKLRGEKFKMNLTKTLGWDFDLELDDEAPVLVETNHELEVVDLEIEQ